MVKALKIVAIVIGILLLFPGACFSILGVAVGGRDGPGLIGIGVMIFIAAGGLLYAGFNKRN